MTITREDIQQALARAYCHDRNAKKELDIDLIVAMADEIMTVLEQHGALSTGEDADQPE